MDCKEHLLHISARDPEKTGAVDASYPDSAAVRLIWKMRRVLARVIARKHVVALFFISLVLFITYHSTTEFPINGASCPSNRTNPHRVATPRVPDQAKLLGMWNELHALFESHPPSPSHIPAPKHKNGIPPDGERFGSCFNMSDAEAQTSRTRHKEVVAMLPDYPRGRFKGKGVVMLAGGKYSEYGATSLGMLREVGSRLPIELWVKDDSEEIHGWCEELLQEGIACRRLADYMDMKTVKHPYQWKVFTILYSSFSEILFLDADSMPLENPDFLFESKIYKDLGAILWPDYWMHTGSPWAPYITGISEQAVDTLQDDKSVESGQLVWNKEKHWKSLVLAAYYNYWGPDFFYTVFNNGYAGWGDKDTFPMGLIATGETYYLVPHGIHTTFVSGTLLGIGMVQGNPENGTTNEPLFIHSNIIKWSARDFFCEHCEAMPNYKPKVSHVENEKSPIIEHLKQGKRIFSIDDMHKKGIDPEPLMWKCMEHTACRSVWSNDEMCKRTRAHMVKTFGYRFNPMATFKDEKVIPNNKICIEGPVAVA